MKLNNLLFFVVGVYVLVKFILPQIDKINKTNTEIALLESSIHKYQVILENKSKIHQLKKNVLKEEKVNFSYVFHNKNNTAVFTNTQKIIKNAAQKANINIKSLRWLSPVDNKLYYEIPIKITFRTYPENFYIFLKQVCKNNKIILSKMLKTKALNKYSKNVFYEIVLKTINIKD
jgi:Tfp pilus assembly protein PilO